MREAGGNGTGADGLAGGWAAGYYTPIRTTTAGRRQMEFRGARPAVVVLSARRGRADVEEYNYGRFGWAIDPEGNRFELWEPR